MLTFQSVSKEIEAYMLAAINDLVDTKRGGGDLGGVKGVPPLLGLPPLRHEALEGTIAPWIKILKRSRDKLKRQIQKVRSEVRQLENKQSELQDLVESTNYRSEKLGLGFKKHRRRLTSGLFRRRRGTVDTHILDVTIEKLTGLRFTANVAHPTSPTTDVGDGDLGDLMLGCMVHIQGEELYERTRQKTAKRNTKEERKRFVVKAQLNSNRSDAESSPNQQEFYDCAFGESLRLKIPPSKRRVGIKQKPVVLVIQILNGFSNEELGEVRLDLSGMILDLHDKKIVKVRPNPSSGLQAGNLHIMLNRKREQVLCRTFNVHCWIIRFLLYLSSFVVPSYFFSR